MPFELFQALSRASASGSKSTVLQPLIWLTVILIIGLGYSPRTTLDWLPVVIAILLCVVISAFLVTYAYFVFKDPDALRSEKFNLSKMAIEKNLIGDDRSGLREMTDLGTLNQTKASLPELERRGEG